MEMDPNFGATVGMMAVAMASVCSIALLKVFNSNK